MKKCEIPVLALWFFVAWGFLGPTLGLIVGALLAKYLGILANP